MRKLGVCEGTVVRPPSVPVPPTTAAMNAVNIELWETCNNLVISWIISSVSDSIAKSIMFIGTASEIWTQLETRFSLSNGSRKYKLSKECFEIKQHGNSVSEYYTSLKCVWEELDSMIVLPRLVTVTPESHTTQDESQKLCFRTMVLPIESRFVKTQFNITSEQFETLMRSVLNDMKNSGISGNNCSDDDLEFVAGATDHMTPHSKAILNAKILKILPKITLPNGQSSDITQIGHVKLNNGIMLKDVLCVPSFKFSLLSIPKLTKDNKTIVWQFSFPKLLLILQDVDRTEKVLGLGNKELQPLSTPNDHRFCGWEDRDMIDNALEFVKGPCASYLADQGIEHQTTCVDRPQQNGRAERKHRHILEVARALRFQATLPLRFWGDCITTATYLINRFPSPILQNKTPYELLLNKVPDYSHLKVFGCFAVATNPSRISDKFASKGVPCVFLGYPAQQKGYKLYNLLTHSCFVSRDVQFHEHIFPFAESSTAQFCQPMPVPMPSSKVIFDEPIVLPTNVPVHMINENSREEGESHTITPAAAEDVPEISSNIPIRKSSRQIKPPGWTKDFVVPSIKPVANQDERNERLAISVGILPLSLFTEMSSDSRLSSFPIDGRIGPDARNGALPEEQLLQITKHKTAKAIWDALKTRHIGEERVQQARLQTLKSDFEMLHMKEDEAIDTFTAKLTTLVNKAASLGHTIEDSVVVRKLLNAVPDKFLQIVASIEQYSDLDEMSVEEAIGRLKTFEERIKVKKGKAFEDQDKLLFAKHNDNGRRHHYDDQGGGRYIPPHSRNRDDNRQHGKEESFSQDYNEEMRKPRDFSKVKCYNCNEYGHYASHCRKRDQRQQRREASNLVEEDLEPTLLMASTSFNKTQKKSSKDTPTNKSIWFAKDYDHEDSKFGEIILEEDKEGHDQEHDKLSVEDQQIEENNRRKPRVKTHFWSTIISKWFKGSNENEDIEDTTIVITGENIGPKPNPSNPNPQAKNGS
ncbi:zinc finger, CCHC-type containing protein [Tanacetum coccineum]